MSEIKWPKEKDEGLGEWAIGYNDAIDACNQAVKDSGQMVALDEGKICNMLRVIEVGVNGQMGYLSVDSREEIAKEICQRFSAQPTKATHYWDEKEQKWIRDAQPATPSLPSVEINILAKILMNEFDVDCNWDDTNESAQRKHTYWIGKAKSILALCDGGRGKK